MAGTSPIAQAAMMDGSAEADRGLNMSHLVLVNSLALVTGPAVSGLLAAVLAYVPVPVLLATAGVVVAAGTIPLLAGRPEVRAAPDTV